MALSHVLARTSSSHPEEKDRRRVGWLVAQEDTEDGDKRITHTGLWEMFGETRQIHGGDSYSYIED